MKRIQHHRCGGPEELHLGGCRRLVSLTDAIPALVELKVHHQPKGKLLIEPAGVVA